MGSVTHIHHFIDIPGNYNDLMLMIYEWLQEVASIARAHVGIELKYSREVIKHMCRTKYIIGRK